MYNWLDWRQKTSESLLLAFGNMLSDLSRYNMCATWQDGTTERVRGLCEDAIRTGEAQGWGEGADKIFTPKLAAFFFMMAEMLGGWPDYNMVDDDPPYVLVKSK